MALRTLIAAAALVSLMAMTGCSWETKPQAQAAATPQAPAAKDTVASNAPSTGQHQAGPSESTPGRTPEAALSPQKPINIPPAAGNPFPSIDQPPGFRTKYARFEPANFNDVPDWRKDQVRDAWQAFLRGCKTLSARQLWSDTCKHARSVSRSDESAIRSFIEREFSLYQVLDPSGGDDGVITGYYEPLLTGSRNHGERYRYPVYGVPSDLLYLDARRMPKDGAKRRVFARIEGRSVVPVAAASAPAPGLYPIELASVRPDVRDRRLRVRLDRNRIVPYYSRAEIESGGLSSAPVLAWVDDPLMLYTMHLQGVGKIALGDGRLIRLSYADQNGHPFRSKVKTAKVRTRGGSVSGDASVEDDSVDAEFDAMYAAQLESSGNAEPSQSDAGLTRGIKVEKDVSAPKLPTSPNTATAASPPSGRAPGPLRDPSYVFFREVPDSTEGPVGALGVPLTAGRSVAVDPRITPLGAPLFLSTRDPQRDAVLNKLVVAQDTGGAIRGALRADYFFGFGPDAGELAHRMKTDGRLWLLLPRSFTPTLAMKGGRTRGSADTAQPECVVSDPDFCVDTPALGEQAVSAAQ